MKIRSKVIYLDGTTVEVTTGPADAIGWEREHGKALAAYSAERYQDWPYELTWRALCRLHGETRSFDEWIAAVSDTATLDEEADAVPPPETVEAGSG